MRHYEPKHKQGSQIEPRVPPHSTDAEQSVLGAMMLEASAGLEAADILQLEHFYETRHADIYRAATNLLRRGVPVDIVSMNEELRKSGKLADVGGSYYLTELNRKTPSAANVAFHARIVLECAIKRQVIAAAGAAMDSAYRYGSDAFEVAEQATSQLTAVLERQVGSGARHISTVLTKLDASVERLRQMKPGEMAGFTTGLFDLDRMTGGLHRANLYIYAARPGMGKTGLLGCVAIAAATAGAVEGSGQEPCRVGILSLEMRDVELVARTVANTAKIDTLKFRDGGWEERDIVAYRDARTAMQTLPIFIEDTPSLTLQQISMRAQLLHRTEKVNLLIVDYLQMVEGDDAHSKNRARELTEIAYGLKAIAKRLDIPVIAAAQLNRELTNRSDKRPQLSDLKESGGIEEAADQVLFIHRPEYYGITLDEDNNPTDGIAELIIAKQRNGRTGTVRVRFVPEYVRFENLSTRSLDNMPHPWQEAKVF